MLKIVMPETGDTLADGFTDWNQAEDWYDQWLEEHCPLADLFVDDCPVPCFVEY